MLRKNTYLSKRDYEAINETSSKFVSRIFFLKCTPGKQRRYSQRMIVKMIALMVKMMQKAAITAKQKSMARSSGRK